MNGTTPANPELATLPKEIKTILEDGNEALQQLPAWEARRFTGLKDQPLVSLQALASGLNGHDNGETQHQLAPETAIANHLGKLGPEEAIAELRRLFHAGDDEATSTLFEIAEKLGLLERL